MGVLSKQQVMCFDIHVSFLLLDLVPFPHPVKHVADAVVNGSKIL